VIRRATAAVLAAATAPESTRLLALLRIALAAIVLAKFSESFKLYNSTRWWRIALCIAFFGGVGGMLVGYRSRLAAATTFGVTLFGWLYFGLERGIERWDHHHVYLLVISLGWLALGPCGRSLSVDRWLAVRRAEQAGRPIPAEVGPGLARLLLRAQIVAIYGWGAFDKMRVGFLRGDELQRQLLIHFKTSDWPPPSGVLDPAFAMMAVGSVLLEWALVFGLWRARWRRYLIPLAFAFHFVIYNSLAVSIFSFLAMVLLCSHLDPGAVHRELDRVVGKPVQDG
jgi:hypothetical protein